MSAGGLGSEFTTFKGYEHRSNANLVLHSMGKPKGAYEPSGEAESLRGKNLPRFGDRALTVRAPLDDAKKKKKRQADGPAAARAAKRARTGPGAAVLDGDGAFHSRPPLLLPPSLRPRPWFYCPILSDHC